MERYTEQDVLQLAKRVNNTKRSYLLVDPLQGKHVPVSPDKTYRLAYSLGEILYENAKNAEIVIGFAETATAIAAVASLAFPENVRYLHTTREQLTSAHIVSFLEEHSHAVDQQIDCTVIAESDPQTIVMIDDEISTGRTIENIVTQLRARFPHLQMTRFVIGSVINRMKDEIRERMRLENIEFVSLVSVADRDFEAAAKAMEVFPAKKCTSFSSDYQEIMLSASVPDLRKAVSVKEWKDRMSVFSKAVFDAFKERDLLHGRLLFLGTEECMTPAILAGRFIENECRDTAVFTHAATRSPIGISTVEHYPCQNGFRIHSFYEAERVNYLYNIQDYDTVAVITDSRDRQQTEKAMTELCGIFRPHCKNIFLIRG